MGQIGLPPEMAARLKCAREPQIIGLTGYAGSGKDLVGTLLAMRGYRRVAFADAVRAEVAEFVAMGPGQQAPYALEDSLRQILFSGDVTLTEVHGKPTSDRMRRILQQWGSEYRRAQNPDYWVIIANDRVKALNGAPVVVTDVRFQNECDWIRGLGGVVWRVMRGSPANEHHSEVDSAALDVDALIDNCGALQDLPLRVLTALGVIQ